MYLHHDCPYPEAAGLEFAKCDIDAYLPHTGTQRLNPLLPPATSSSVSLKQGGGE